MDEHERELHEYLDALTEGSMTLDECLRMYPEGAAERAQLIAAAALARAWDASPDADWAARARQRFLFAAGRTLHDALDAEPEPSFFAAARMRFLLAAQRMRQDGAKTAARRFPIFGSPGRALGALAAGLAVFFLASSYTVRSADAALPGDWNYGLKLQTERVRLALAFTEDRERDVKLDIAEERLHEIEALASKGKIIGPGVLDRYADQTQPLVDAAAEGQLDAGEAARLQAVSLRGARVLDAVEAHVAPGAATQLAAAKDVSTAAITVTVASPDRPPLVIAPDRVVETPTAEPTDVPPTSVPATPEGEPTASDTAQPAATATPAPPDETASRDVIIGETAMVELNEIKLFTLVAGNLKALIPGAGTGWFIDGVPSDGIPVLLTLKTQDQQSFVVLNTRTGDMYWYVSPAGNNRFDEVQMRLTSGGQVFQADPNALRLFYGDAARVPLLIMESIEVLPDPTPAPEPTEAVPAPAP